MAGRSAGCCSASRRRSAGCGASEARSSSGNSAVGRLAVRLGGWHARARAVSDAAITAAVEARGARVPWQRAGCNEAPSRRTSVDDCGTCREDGCEAGEVGHGGDERDLHADLGLAEEASEAGAEPRHARDLPFDEQALSPVITVLFGRGVTSRVDEERLMGPDLNGPGGLLGRHALGALRTARTRLRGGKRRAWRALRR